MSRVMQKGRNWEMTSYFHDKKMDMCFLEIVL